jgi:DNA-binding MarR family transcriptional regulator
LEAIEHCISFLSGKAAQNISRLSRERLSRCGLTPIQFAVLQALKQTPGLNATELGDVLVIDSATITGVIDRLCRMGTLVRSPDAKDRRINRLSLTGRGTAVVADAGEVMDRINREVADAFGPDAARLWQFLERLAAFHPEKAAAEQDAKHV